MLAFHGIPRGDLQYLLHTVEPGRARPATAEEVTVRLGEYADWPLLLCGHTHVQGQLRLPSGALVLNPDSVGWPAYNDDILVMACSTWSSGPVAGRLRWAPVRPQPVGSLVPATVCASDRHCSCRER